MLEPIFPKQRKLITHCPGVLVQWLMTYLELLQWHCKSSTACLTWYSVAWAVIGVTNASEEEDTPDGFPICTGAVPSFDLRWRSVWWFFWHFLHRCDELHSLMMWLSFKQLRQKMFALRRENFLPWGSHLNFWHVQRMFSWLACNTWK